MTAFGAPTAVLVCVVQCSAVRRDCRWRWRCIRRELCRWDGTAIAPDNCLHYGIASCGFTGAVPPYVHITLGEKVDSQDRCHCICMCCDGGGGAGARRFSSLSINKLDYELDCGVADWRAASKEL